MNVLKTIILVGMLLIIQSTSLAGQIHEAAKRGDIQAVHELLQNGVKINEADDEYGATALHWSAVKGQRDVAEYLIERGANITKKNRDGDTALHLAVAYGRKNLVKLFLAKGVKIDERRRDGATSLYIAVGRNQKDIAELLIASGAEIDASNQDGVTPLYHAAGKNFPAMVILLLTKGADINSPNKHGDTPLHVAAAYGNKKMVELLLSKGANPFVKSNDGSTPAQFARQHGHPDIVQILVTRQEFTTYTDNDYKFSIKYPDHWNVLTPAQIKSISATMTGTAPIFVTQSPTRESIFVIAVPTTTAADKVSAENSEVELRRQYSGLTGTPARNWVRESESIRDVNGVKALVVVWKMPQTQGVVLMQKHMCLVSGKMAFLVSATSDIDSWKGNDAKLFTPTFESFQVMN